MMDSRNSFRDPSGFCLESNGRVYRFLNEAGAAQCESFRSTPVAKDLVAKGKLISARRLDGPEVAELKPADADAPTGWARPAAVLEHDRISFPSYPFEWPAEMLWQAGRLTLDIALALAPHGFGLKDATPRNVLFRGAQAVFVDWGSFEPRAPGDPVWLPHAQFVRTFLLPLLAAKRWGKSPGEVFLTRRDGLEPEEVYQWCGRLERLRPQLLPLVTIPTWLKSNSTRNEEALYRRATMADPEKARFIFESLLKRLSRGLDRLRPSGAAASTWSDYMATHSYSDEAFASKQEFVGHFLEHYKPRRVLDIGANTGHFSRLAAKQGAEVVAIDYDPASVGLIYRQADAQGARILPLVVDLARPTPGLGWRNTECRSFLDRARGHFDCLMMLAVIHHLLVTDRIPLREVLDLAADLTNSFVVLEYVDPQDAMFKRLTRGREALHSDLTQTAFEAAVGERFEILSTKPLAGTRRLLYGLKRKTARP